jgi:hypothetical protein
MTRGEPKRMMWVTRYPVRRVAVQGCMSEGARTLARLRGTAQEYRAVTVCQALVPLGFLLLAAHSVPEPVVTRLQKRSREFR